MFSALALAVITIAQLSPFVLNNDNCLANFELIVDKFTTLLLLILLYCKGSFKRNYIRVFILMLVVLVGLLLINKLSGAQLCEKTKGRIWKVEIIGKAATMCCSFNREGFYGVRRIRYL